MTKAEVCKNYREEYGWEMPTLKLARIIYAKENFQFKDVEDVRTVLRGIEGKSKAMGYKVIKEVETRPKNPYNLPKSDATILEPYILKAKRVLILSDIHLPYHDIDAITVAFNWAKKEKPDAILLNGDLLDFHSLSRYVKNPKMRDFAAEIDTFKHFFEVLSKVFECKIHYKLGNHCERYEHFLFMKAHELVGVEEFDFENIIKARANGINVIKDKRIVKCGNLNVFHGHEFFGSGGEHIAKGLWSKTGTSSLQGHNHRTQEYSYKNVDGKMYTTFASGCLCELQPAYMPHNQWNHGFAFVEVDGDDFHLRNLRIHNGKVL
jgi:predicted phosphodiesterase